MTTICIFNNPITKQRGVGALQNAPVYGSKTVSLFALPLERVPLSKARVEQWRGPEPEGGLLIKHPNLEQSSRRVPEEPRASAAKQSGNRPSWRGRSGGFSQKVRP